MLKQVTFMRIGLSCLGIVLLASQSVADSDRANHSTLLPTFFDQFCITCHDGSESSQGIDFSELDVTELHTDDPSMDVGLWENVLRRMQSRQMPPADAERPALPEYENAIEQLAELLDSRAKRLPWNGKQASVRRLTRTEYQNAVRDLVGLDIDVTRWIPADESSLGFDNITVSDLSPVLLDRYITAAQHISQMAVARADDTPEGRTIRVPPDLSQEDHISGLPLGTRGGVIFNHVFTQPGDYEIQIRLARDRDEKVEGLNGEHEIDVLVDRERKHRFSVDRPKNGDYTHSDSHLRTRIHVGAGQRSVGVTFPKRTSSLLEIKRQPFDASFNRHRHPRQSPAIYEVSIVGPFDCGNKVSSTLITRNQKKDAFSEAERIIRALLRKAYRRAVGDHDLEVPMKFFRDGLAKDGFDRGIELALASILTNPHFLFRAERVSSSEPSTSSHDVELAADLSFFLWSSLPDESLVALAESQQLSRPKILRQQVKRMLRDPRSSSLVTNFASQWLQLRNLDSIKPDMRLFPDFDDNLRYAMRRETELLFESIIRQDRPVTDLISADFTFLNDRLARHYGIKGVRGSHFRSVKLGPDTHRGGILRHASILTVTSYATRTSPTIRGNWVLMKVLGTHVPPPPPNVPPLKPRSAEKPTTLRETLALHRSNPSCASCHDLMDPIGFALENFDAVGRYRIHEGEQPLDVSATLPSGSEITGFEELESSIMKHPEIFVTAMVEQLMTFALGRGVESRDGADVRRVVQFAKENDYRFSSVVLGIVRSRPFQWRSIP